MKDLSTHVIPFVATKWDALGLHLLADEHQHWLGIIEKDNRNDTLTCCRQMFLKWLQINNEATWDQLVRAIRGIHLNDTASNIESLFPQGKEVL